MRGGAGGGGGGGEGLGGDGSVAEEVGVERDRSISE